jgi:hypothetical protein
VRSTQGTLKEVALRHGIPPQTVIAWYRREDWASARNRWREKQLSDNDAPTQPVPCAEKPGNAASVHASMIERLLSQLKSLDNALDAANTADAWHKLSTARQKLFDQWRVLSGIPLPGSRRPPREKSRREYVPPAPVD